MEKEYTITVFSENQPGLAHRITSILLKQKINIYSLSATTATDEDKYKFVIVVKISKKDAENISKQISKQVEVFETFVIPS